MNHAALLVEISDALSNLKNDVFRKIFTEVSEFDNLMEQLPSFHD